jgi:hypothetical protein
MGVAGFHYNDIAGALWNMGVAGFHLNDIAGALFHGGLTQDAGAIAGALWNMGVAGFHYTDIAAAIYNGVTTDMGRIARGLYDGLGDHNLANIASGLSGITGDVTSIVNGLWHIGIAGYTYKDIAGAIYNGVTTDMSRIARGLFVGLGDHNLTNIAWGLSGITGDPSRIAGALWNMGIAGYTPSDIAAAIYHGVTTDLNNISQGLSNAIGINLSNALSVVGLGGGGVGHVLNDIGNLLNPQNWPL